jgi:multiple sugar transport system permease protein
MTRSGANTRAFVVFGLLAVTFVFTLAPVAWMVSTSFKDAGAMFAIPPQWIPAQPTLEPYAALFTRDHPFGVWLRNTAMVALAAALMSVTMATFAAYGFSRYAFRQSGTLLLVIVATQMFPPVLSLISIYTLFRDVGLLNTLQGLLLVYVVISLPFSIWMLKNYFDTIPRELEEAALLDGCGRLATLFRVVLPLMGPALVSVAIFSFLVAWNELLFALTFITQDASRLVSPGLVIRYAGQYQSSQNELMAASLLIGLPVIALFIGLQRYVIAGLTMGSVKG